MSIGRSYLPGNSVHDIQQPGIRHQFSMCAVKRAIRLQHQLGPLYQSASSLVPGTFVLGPGQQDVFWHSCLVHCIIQLGANGPRDSDDILRHHSAALTQQALCAPRPSLTPMTLRGAKQGRGQTGSSYSRGSLQGGGSAQQTGIPDQETVRHGPETRRV